MKLKITIVLFVITCVYNTINAQKEILTLPVSYKSTFYDSKESLAMSDTNTDELVLFIEDVENTKVILLDKTFLLKEQFSIKNLERSFKTFVGYQINIDGTYSMYFSNKSKKKFGVLLLDFKKGEVIQKKLDFKLKGESYIESISHRNSFYLMSVTKASSDVHFYTFDALGNVSKKKTLDFSFLNKEGNNGFNLSAHSYMGSTLGSGLMKMDSNSPNAIEVSSKPNKIYTIEDDFVFTFDNEKNKTQVAIVSPKIDFKLSSKVFNMPTLEAAGFNNHNSYLYDDKMYQVNSTPKELVLSILDYNTDELVKTFNIKKEDSITFKNTPIIQEGTSFGNNTRELEDTGKFLRKVSRGDIGIAVYLTEEKYKVTIGSKIEKPSGGGFGPMGGFPMASFGAISTTFNPTFFAYGNYSSTKSTYIDCMFDGDFNHVRGEVPVTVFDKIDNFEDKFIKQTSKTESVEQSTSELDDFGLNDSENKPKLKNVFYHNNKLYFGFIGSQDKSYHLIEFKQ